MYQKSLIPVLRSAMLPPYRYFVCLMKAALPSFSRQGIYLFLLIATLCYTFPGYAAKRKVLFLGNSYTYFNDMPQIVANMASTTGDTLVFEMYAPGGYTFEDHGADTASENKIKKGGWDYLVLQEQSQLPSFPFYESQLLPDLCSLFAEHNPCGRILFYMTWGRKNGDATNCAAWPPVCTYLGMDSLLRLRYTEMAVEYKAELSPAGAAWRYTRQHHPGIELYQPDESHPSAAGSYLVASCFYTAIFRKDPTAVSYNSGLTTTDATTLRQAAKAVVFDSLSFWDHVPKVPVTNFTYTMGNGINEVIFRNWSSFANTYLWDFGDGATSTDAFPVHSYTSDGTYTITLHAYNCDIDTVYESTHQATVTFCPFTPTITPDQLTLCPGDSDTLSTQVYDAYQWYDEFHQAVAGATGQSLIVSTNSRWYYVSATLNGCTEHSVPADVNTIDNFPNWFFQREGKLIGEDSACAGDTIVLKVAFNKPPGAEDSLIDWRFNGLPVTGHHNDTLLITQSGSYEATIRHERCPAFDHTLQLNFTFVPCGLGLQQPELIPIVIAPNPVQDILNISSTAFLSATYSIHMINQLGQTVYRQQSNVAERQYVDVSGYPDGIYFISLIKEGHTVYRGKIVKR